MCSIIFYCRVEENVLAYGRREATKENIGMIERTNVGMNLGWVSFRVCLCRLGSLSNPIDGSIVFFSLVEFQFTLMSSSLPFSLYYCCMSSSILGLSCLIGNTGMYSFWNSASADPIGGGLVYRVIGVGLVDTEVFQQYDRMTPMMKPTRLPISTMVTMERRKISKLVHGTPDTR